MTVKGKVKFFNETKGFPAANAVLGTTYGNPGGGNFTMPDMRGRFFFNLDADGSGRITSAGGNFDGTVLGNAGGTQSRNLSASQIPQLSFTPSGTIGGSQSFANNLITGGPGSTIDVGGNPVDWGNTLTVQGSNFTFTGNAGTVGNASPTQVAMIPPAMGINCMMRIA